MTGVDSAYAGDRVQSSHVPSTVLGAGDPGVKDTVLAPAELSPGRRQCRAVGRATALKSQRLGLNLTSGPS